MEDVSFLAAHLVGAEGVVVGVDLSTSAIAAATSRRDAAGLSNVKFIAGDAPRIAIDRQFDAVIGRYDLMY